MKSTHRIYLQVSAPYGADRADQVRAIERELVEGREVLEARLGSPVRHLALPWGVSGRSTRGLLERAG